VTLRCVIDGLLLPATLWAGRPPLLAWDGDESFGLEAVEALYYEVVSATRSELLGLERARYRLLRLANDFQQDEAA
jgi:hypothetical protein